MTELRPCLAAGRRPAVKLAASSKPKKRARSPPLERLVMPSRDEWPDEELITHDRIKLQARQPMLARSHHG